MLKYIVLNIFFYLIINIFIKDFIVSSYLYNSNIYIKKIICAKYRISTFKLYNNNSDNNNNNNNNNEFDDFFDDKRY